MSTFAELAADLAAAVADGLGVPASGAAGVQWRAWVPDFNPATGKPGSFAPAVGVAAVRGAAELRRESVPGSASPGRLVEIVTYAWAAADASMTPVAAAAVRPGDHVVDSGVAREVTAVRRPGSGAIIEVETRRAVSA